MTLPNALIGGAPKCGTTSLADALAGHQDVFIPFRKELSFFDVDSNYTRGLTWYENFFAAGAESRVRLEATPDYLASAPACDRIRKDVSDCKLVFILRDPVERAYSHYWFRARSGRERRSFEDALRDEQSNPNGSSYLIRLGHYSAQLARYFDSFPAEQILVLRFSALTAMPEKSLETVQKFLGVPATITHLPKSNPASEPKSEVLQSTVRRLATGQGTLKRALRFVVPDDVRYRIRRQLNRWNAKPTGKPTFDPRARHLLIDAFRDEPAQLEKLLGVSFDDWRLRWEALS